MEEEEEEREKTRQRRGEFRHISMNGEIGASRCASLRTGLTAWAGQGFPPHEMVSPSQRDGLMLVSHSPDGVTALVCGRNTTYRTEYSRTSTVVRVRTE